MNDDEPLSIGNTSHQNGSSPYSATRETTNDFDEFDQERGEGSPPENETKSKNKDGIFPSEKSSEALRKAEKKKKRLQ